MIGTNERSNCCCTKEKCCYGVTGHSSAFACNQTRFQVLQAAGLSNIKSTKQTSTECHRPHVWLQHHHYTTGPRRFPGIMRLYLIITDWSSAAIMQLQSGQLWHFSLVLPEWGQVSHVFIVFGLICTVREDYTVNWKLLASGLRLRLRFLSLCFP